MKTITISFNKHNAIRVGILLKSLELQTLVTWCNEGIMDGITIFCVLRLNKENEGITPELQLEKIRENNFITIQKG